MTTSALTFTHTDAEFTIYTDGSFEQTDGCDLDEVQEAKYTNYIEQVAAEFATTIEDADNDTIVTVSFNDIGEVTAEYFTEEDEDFGPYSVPEFA